MLPPCLATGLGYHWEMSSHQAGVHMRDRLRTTSAELDDRRLQSRFADVDVVSIADVQERVPVRSSPDPNIEQTRAPAERRRRA